MPERPLSGRSVVTRRAIIDIVRSAVQGSYGVTGLSDPDLASRLLRRLGLAERGIKLNRREGLALDLYLTVAYGVPVAEVARQVDSAVRYALRHALARELDRLTIHIDGLRYQPAVAPAQLAVQPAAAPSLAPANAGLPSNDATGLATGNGVAATGGADAAQEAATLPGRSRRRRKDQPAPGERG